MTSRQIYFTFLQHAKETYGVVASRHEELSVDDRCAGLVSTLLHRWQHQPTLG